MKHYLKADWFILGLAAYWLVGAAAAIAETSPPIQTPKIIAGPPFLVTANRGDILKLKIEYTSNKNLFPQAKWVIRSQSLICRDAFCTLKTSSLAPGNHAVYIVVFDDAGSDSLKFNLKLANPVLGKASKEITVPSEQPSDEQKDADSTSKQKLETSLSAHSLTSVQGRTFSHSRSVVHIIGQETEQFGSSDAVRTGIPGLMKIWLAGSDETWLLEGSMARLGGKKGGRGTLRLERGTIRSRTLGSTDQGWDIAAGGFVFRSEGRRDLIVQRLPDDHLLVTALRGNIRIHAEHDFKGQADENTFFKIVQGSTVRLKITTTASGDDPGRPEQTTSPAEQEVIAGVIRTTTPQYLEKREATNPAQFPFLRNRVPASIKDAIKSAKAALGEGDPWLAIEPLLYRSDDAVKSDEATYLIGRCYVEMLLLAEGEEWLQKSLAIRNKSNGAGSYDAKSAAEIMLGVLYFRKKSWTTAAIHFNAANLDGWMNDPEFNGERSYMVGKSCALGEFRHCARLYLPRAAANGPTVEVKEEARLLLKKIDLLPGASGFAKLDVGYNSNIFGLKNPGNSVSLPAGVTHNQTASWYGSLGFMSRGSANDESQQDDQNRFGIEFKLNLEQSGYLKSDLTNYGLSTYGGQVGVFYTLASRRPITENSSGRSPIMDLGVNGYMIMGGVGNQRVHDEAGAGLSLSIPWFLGLELSYKRGRAVDPQPNLEHVIDYMTGETSGSADDTAAISRIQLKLIPFGPNSLEAESRGRTQVSITGEKIAAARELFPDGTGPIQLSNVKFLMAKKVLDRAILSFHIGAKSISRSISTGDSEILKVPLTQTQAMFGLDYEHNLTPFITFNLTTNQSIATSSPSSFDGFSRTLVTTGAKIDF